MAELENSSYQDNVTQKEIKPLDHFLEGVQAKYGLGKTGTRERFDPYFRDKNKPTASLGDALSNIQMLREAEEDEEELDDVGDVEMDADEAPEESPEDDLDIDGDMERGEPVDREITDDDIDNETDPEEGRIVGDDGETVGDIFLGPGQRYFMGASTDPQMVIVSKVSDEYVWYNAFPFKKAEKIKKEIAADLFKTGSETWLKDPKSKSDEELRASIESILNGRPGDRVSLDDYQFSNIQVKYTGESSGDLEPWKELEAEYDVAVDSNLTNKQTYNLRMNNKELERFRSDLQEKPVAERNFKIIRIVTEEREYMIEAAQNPTPKPQVRELEEFEDDEVRATALKNTAAGYGAEDFYAGQRVEYSKQKDYPTEWTVMDFVPFGEDMTLILLSKCGKYIAEFIKPKDVKVVDGDDDNDPKGGKPKGYCGKNVDGKPVDKTPKDKEVKFPESDLKTGETQEQKILDEELDPQKAAGILVEFINKDPELSKNRFTPVVKNLQRKRREGNYDSDLAVKAFRILIDEGASKYYNENDGEVLGEIFNSHRDMFPNDVREKVAEDFRNQFEANVEMGNFEEGTIDKKIETLVLEAEQLNEQNEEGVGFTPAEIREFKKFDNANVSAENVAVYNWDKGTNNYKVKVTKKPRKATEDMVYSAAAYEGEGEEKIDSIRTKDSESFRTQEDLPILRDFLTDLNLNEAMNEGADVYVVYDDDLKKYGEFNNQKQASQKAEKLSRQNSKKEFYVVDMSTIKNNEDPIETSTVASYFKGKLNEEDADVDTKDEKVDTTGLADKKSVSEGDVHPEQLIMGIKVEMEHTKDKDLAKQIALDHLVEMPDYYTRLNKMEKESSVDEEMDEEDGSLEQKFEKAAKYFGKSSGQGIGGKKFRRPVLHTEKDDSGNLVVHFVSSMDAKKAPETFIKTMKEKFGIEQEPISIEAEPDKSADGFTGLVTAVYSLNRINEEEKPKKKKKDRTNPDGKKPERQTTKMVNALPIRKGKKIRSEVVGDVRIRYKTFEEKRKEDIEKKKKDKKKGK